MSVKNVQSRKRCSKCEKVLPLTSFSKKTKSRDGFQEWCKNCQSESNKESNIRRLNKKYHSYHERLRYYKNKYGLSYTLLKSSSERRSKKVSFKCLHCGNEIECLISKALERKFLCDDCIGTNDSIKNKGPLMYHSNKEEVKHKCSCNNCKETHSEENTELNNLYEWIRQQDPTNIQHRTETLKVIYVPVVKQLVEQPKTENRFIKWFKKLFNN